MTWFTDPDRVKVHWRIIALNLAAVFLNLAIGIWSWKAMSIANFISAAFSAWVAYSLWKKIPRIKKEQQERIMDILRGKYQNHTGGFGIDN